MVLITSPLNDSLHNPHSVNSSKYFGLSFVVYFFPPVRYPTLHSTLTRIRRRILRFWITCFSYKVTVFIFAAFVLSYACFCYTFAYLCPRIQQGAVFQLRKFSVTTGQATLGYTAVKDQTVSLLGWFFPLVNGLVRGFQFWVHVFSTHVIQTRAFVCISAYWACRRLYVAFASWQFIKNAKSYSLAKICSSIS